MSLKDVVKVELEKALADFVCRPITDRNVASMVRVVYTTLTNMLESGLIPEMPPNIEIIPNPLDPSCMVVGYRSDWGWISLDNWLNEIEQPWYSDA
jgi:hypothetical protein